MKKEIKRIEISYGDKIKKLETNKGALIEKFKNIISEDYGRKYIQIKANLENIARVNREITEILKYGRNTLDSLLGTLYNNGITQFDHEEISPGTLIGLVDKKGTNLPKILVYIFRVRDTTYYLYSYSQGLQKPLNKYPYKLVESMKKENYSIKDIPKIYSLPFSTEGFTADEPLIMEIE